MQGLPGAGTWVVFLGARVRLAAVLCVGLGVSPVPSCLSSAPAPTIFVTPNTGLSHSRACCSAVPEAESHLSVDLNSHTPSPAPKQGTMAGGVPLQPWEDGSAGPRTSAPWGPDASPVS